MLGLGSGIGLLPKPTAADRASDPTPPPDGDIELLSL